MANYINDITAPWILGSLGLLVVLALTRVYASWRDVKRSPYFFMRQQAEQRLQSYLFAIVAMLVAAGGTVAFASQPSPDQVVRMALLAQTKPVEAAELAAAVSEEEIPTIDLASPETFEVDSRSLFTNQALTIAAPFNGPLERPGPLSPSVELAATPSLPEEFDQFEPTEELSPDTTITPLVFSLDVSDEYDPISPRRSFGPGFYTIYATFDYEGMAEGMAWSWIWRYNGEVVNGGNELWAYGDEGPGWIYYEPPEGFSTGEYVLELWVNGELIQRASLVVEGEAANQ